MSFVARGGSIKYMGIKFLIGMIHGNTEVYGNIKVFGNIRELYGNMENVVLVKFHISLNVSTIFQQVMYPSVACNYMYI